MVIYDWILDSESDLKKSDLEKSDLKSDLKANGHFGTMNDFYMTFMGSIRLANWLPFTKIGEFFRKSEVFWKWAIKVMIWTRVSWRESLIETYRIDHISGVSDYYPIIIGEIEFNWWSVRFLSDRSQWIMSWDLLWYHDRREADLSIAKNFSGISNRDRDG